MAELLAPYYTTQSLKSHILLVSGSFFLPSPSFSPPFSSFSPLFFFFSFLLILSVGTTLQLLPRDFILSLLDSFSPSVKCTRVCCSPSHKNEELRTTRSRALASMSRAWFLRWPTCLVSMIVGKIMRLEERIQMLYRWRCQTFDRITKKISIL